jgi:SulP family sulfate permease
MSEAQRGSRPGSKDGLEGRVDGIVKALLPGLFSGVLVVIMSVSFAALIFSGELSVYIPQGIALAIATAVIVGIGLALFSDCRQAIYMVDEDTAPVYALLVSLVIAALPAGTSPAVIFASCIAAIVFSTVLAGVGLTLLGVLKFGGLIQFLPHSVLGGYFSALGWLLIAGGLRVATGTEFTSLDEISYSMRADSLLAWLPALFFVLWLMSMNRRIPRSRLLPGTILFAVPAWYALAMLAGYTPQSLMQSGMLLGPFSSEGSTLIQLLGGIETAGVRWPAILSNFGVIAAIFMISVLSMVLSISGLGLLTREELDMNRELKLVGLANIASGLGGGMTGLPSYSLSALAVDMGAPKNAWVGLITVSICVLVFYFGMELVAYTPRFVLGALLVYIGTSFLREWLIEAWRKFPPLEYLVIPIILLTSATVGFLQGILVGLFAAVVLFVVKYSQTRVVRYVATGAELKSNVDRNPVAKELVRASGGELLVLGLQGYLFFGTAGRVYRELSGRVGDRGKIRLKYAVIDFSYVTGLDSSAALNFQRMAQLAAKSGFNLLIAGLDQELLARLRQGGFEDEYGHNVRIQPDLDRAIEWCENDLLSQHPIEDEVVSCFDGLRPYLGSDEELAIFKGYLEKREVAESTALTRQGDESRELFFIETASASAFITDAHGERHRVRRTRRGTVYGEMGFYLDIPRTATVISDEGGIVYVLSLDSLAELESRHAEIAAALHRYMVVLVSERLQFTTQTLKTMFI